ncbi:hypothetical protein [Butyrivibrio sp. INlla21]|uniref:hypothetical protein n=1 Tax=Butyrivibrio sp. INlla21 TaxID=1520811 RepID=UPI0008F3F747|nr:hypothetical protein [Butyrivibrio sp. INlla21]SFU32790.1 hypothetical protein SAMN02910342_00092 [Butyrivibrio sp. INlla21]
MSKKHKNQNVNVETVNEIEGMEDNEMTEKKNIIERVKDFGNKVPKPVKFIAGGVAAAAAIAGTALVVISKVRGNEDDEDFDDVEDFETEVDEVETEAPVEE